MGSPWSSALPGHHALLADRNLQLRGELPELTFICAQAGRFSPRANLLLEKLPFGGSLADQLSCPWGKCPSQRRLDAHIAWLAGTANLENRPARLDPFQFRLAGDREYLLNSLPGVGAITAADPDRGSAGARPPRPPPDCSPRRPFNR